MAVDGSATAFFFLFRKPNREMSLPFRSRLCLRSASAGETPFVDCWKRRHEFAQGHSSDTTDAVAMTSFLIAVSQLLVYNCCRHC